MALESRIGNGNGNAPSAATHTNSKTFPDSLGTSSVKRSDILGDPKAKPTQSKLANVSRTWQKYKPALGFLAASALIFTGAALITVLSPPTTIAAIVGLVVLGVTGALTAGVSRELFKHAGKKDSAKDFKGPLPDGDPAIKPGASNLLNSAEKINAEAEAEEAEEAAEAAEAAAEKINAATAKKRKAEAEAAAEAAEKLQAEAAEAAEAENHTQQKK